MEKGEMYKKPYLNDVIFRIDFSTILKLAGNKKEAAEDFHKFIFEKFPIVKFKKNNKLNIKFDNTSGSLKELSNEGNLIWVFNSEDELKEVELSATNLVLHYKKGAYTNFTNFLDDVLLLIKSLELYTPIKLKRLGLRYINQISGKTTEELKDDIVPKYFNEYVNELNDGEKFIQSLTRYSIIKNDYVLNFQYGLFNPAYPNPDFDKDFILDFDCMTKEVESLDDVKDELIKMNDFIRDKFEDAITNKLRSEMGED